MVDWFVWEGKNNNVVLGYSTCEDTVMSTVCHVTIPRIKPGHLRLYDVSLFQFPKVCVSLYFSIWKTHAASYWHDMCLVATDRYDFFNMHTRMQTSVRVRKWMRLPSFRHRYYVSCPSCSKRAPPYFPSGAEIDEAVILVWLLSFNSGGAIQLFLT